MEEINSSKNSEVDSSAIRIRHLTRTKRIRRVASFTIGFIGAIDLFSSLTPPLRRNLHHIRNVLPFGGVTITASVLVALSGLLLIFLARGVRRGQRQALHVVILLLAISTIAHIAKGFDLPVALLSIGVLIFLIATRSYFKARIDLISLRSGVLTLILGGVLTVLAGSLGIKTAVFVADKREHQHYVLSWSSAFFASFERLFAVATVSLPDHIDDIATPVLTTLGISFVLVALSLAFRPVVDRRFIHRSENMGRAFEIVKMYGKGTLDYFALRDDKKTYLYRESLVAYAIYGGVCLISPDPIGPPDEREECFKHFVDFADNQGWTVGVIGAGEDWLDIYKAAGLNTVYMGDEAVVEVQKFSLQGGNFKGLRQAYNRIAKYGYTIEFYDPLEVDGQLKSECQNLIPKTRRGEAERGFSMTLGRIFDPRDKGLLLAVAKDKDQKTVAFCHFVPASGINGFSLDSMRRDPDKSHPNGLIDFVLCATIFHLKEEGYDSLDLNFATFRSYLAGEKGDGTSQKLKKWILTHLSGSMQIESLWKFNAKYYPTWLPRYVAFEAVEMALPTAIAIARAESFAELPVLGRFFTAKPKEDLDEIRKPMR